MKNILICVTGLTPQVVTSTLYALTVQNNKEIHEIIIVTTDTGKKLIEGKIPYKIDGKEVIIKLSDKIEELTHKYKISIPKFNSKNIISVKSDNATLKDIRSNEDNELFPNKLCEIIKEKSNNSDTTLFCSMSGGRKTMSVFMGFALSLYGRNQDKLYHVLTTEENEFNKLFFFPPTPAENSEVELSEIPFVKLRGIFEGSENKKEFDNLKYSEIVEKTQYKLDIAFEDYLRINVSSGNIFYKNKKKPFGHLSPTQMNFYLNLLEKLKRNRSIPMIELVSNKRENIRNADSTIVKINTQINKALGEDPILYEEFKIQKMGSLKYDIGYPDNNQNDSIILTTNSKGQKKLNPGLAKYGMMADEKRIIKEYN